MNIYVYDDVFDPTVLYGADRLNGITVERSRLTLSEMMCLGTWRE